MLKALIFDFDGLILDTETPEYLAWKNIYQEHGFELPHEEWSKIVGGYGLSDFDAAEYLARLSQGRLDSASLRTRHRLESGSQIQVQEILPGVMDIIHEAKRLGLKLAIASSSPRAWVDAHAKRLDILDDFPMLWAWFEEDDILSGKFGLPRLHTDEQGYFKYRELWHLLIERLSLEYAKKLRDDASYHDHTTTLIEFSRGSEHGGYAEAFQHLSNDVLTRAVILYVRVPFEESLRKNHRRFNPDKPDSILEHGLTDEKLARLYRDDDWSTIAPDESGHLVIRGQNVPYTVFPNEDDVTTGKPGQLSARLESVLNGLWELHREK